MPEKIKSAIWFVLCILLLSPAAISCQGTPGQSPASTTAATATQAAVDFGIKNISVSPIVAGIKQNVTVTVDVSNPGDAPATNTIALMVGGSKAESKSVNLGPKATQKVSFTFTRETAGECKVQVGSLSSTVFFTGPGENITDIIAKVNPDLAKELLKLPDLKEIDEKDNAALGKILMLASDEKNKAFMDVLLNEGVKDKRPYCAALEALLWLAYDYDSEKLSINFSRYNIHGLLTDSWRNSTTSNNFKSDKWQKLDDVVTRLNSPRLVSMYMKDNIKYDTSQADTMTSKRVSNVFNLNDVFTNKKGVCHEMVIFAQHCLMKNGYTYEAMNKGGFGTAYVGIGTATGAIGHAVCMVKENDAYYTLNNGILCGPYPNMDTAVNSSALSVGMPTWSAYWIYEVDVKTDNRKTEEGRTVTADAVKGKNLIQEKVVEQWPATSALLDDALNDCTAPASNSHNIDIKSVKTFRDDKYLYVSIKLAANLEPLYSVGYYIDLDFDGDKKYEYEFGTNLACLSIIYDKRWDKNNKTAVDAWWTFATASQDTVEFRIPLKEYLIPGSVYVSAAVSEKRQELDVTEWLKAP